MYTFVANFALSFSTHSVDLESPKPSKTSLLYGLAEYRGPREDAIGSVQRRSTPLSAHSCMSSFPQLPVFLINLDLPTSSCTLLPLILSYVSRTAKLSDVLASFTDHEFLFGDFPPLYSCLIIGDLVIAVQR